MGDAKKVNFGKKPDLEVVVYLDTSDPDNPQVLSLEDEKGLDKANLPEHIIKLVSKWKRSNWILQQLIEANSFSEKLLNGRTQRFFDGNAMMQAQIRCLLVSWNLSEYDSDLTLSFSDSIDNPKIKILDDKTMTKLGEISPPTLIADIHARMILGSVIKNQKTMESVKI